MPSPQNYTFQPSRRKLTKEDKARARKNWTKAQGDYHEFDRQVAMDFDNWRRHR